MWKGDVDRERVLIDSSMLCRKAPSLYEDFGKGPPPQKTSDHIHITLITVCCYNRYILLLNVCYLSLCLICNLNFILGMYVGGKTACYIIGLSAICVFSRPLGSWSTSSADSRGMTDCISEMELTGFGGGTFIDF